MRQKLQTLHQVHLPAVHPKASLDALCTYLQHLQQVHLPKVHTKLSLDILDVLQCPQMPRVLTYKP